MLITDLDKKCIEKLVAEMSQFVESEPFPKEVLPKRFEDEFVSEKYRNVKYAMRLSEIFNENLQEKYNRLELMIELKQVKAQENISWGSMNKIKSDLLAYKQDLQLVLQKLPELYMVMLS